MQVYSMQSKIKSLTESIVNTFAGMCISFIVQVLIYPILNIQVSINQNIIITFVFTVVSILRSYIIRRIFNRL